MHSNSALDTMPGKLSHPSHDKDKPSRKTFRTVCLSGARVVRSSAGWSRRRSETLQLGHMQEQGKERLMPSERRLDHPAEDLTTRAPEQTVWGMIKTQMHRKSLLRFRSH
jgi:hypothetical protein